MLNWSTFWSVYHRRSIVVLVRINMSRYNWHLKDIFNAFDVKKKGLLTCTELYSGIRFLKIKVSPEAIHDLVRSADVDGDGMLSIFEFQRVFSIHTPEELHVKTFEAINEQKFSAFDEKKSAIDRINLIVEEVSIPQISIAELFCAPNAPNNPANKKMNDRDFQRVAIAERSVSDFKAIWTSRNLGVRRALGVFEPLHKVKWLQRRFVKHSKMLVLGCYAVNS